MNAVTPFSDFRPAYQQIDALEKRFVDGYVADVEIIAEKAGVRLLAALQMPFPFELDQRAKNFLVRPLVKAAIAERVRELSQLYDVSTYKTLKSFAALAYSNIADYFIIDQYTGLPEFNFANVAPEKMEAVKSIEIEDKPRGGRKMKITLHDKLGALNSLARYQGLLTEDNEHWRQSSQQEKADTVKPLPIGISDDDAAEIYARAISGG